MCHGVGSGKTTVVPAGNRDEQRVKNLAKYDHQEVRDGPQWGRVVRLLGRPHAR